MLNKVIVVGYSGHSYSLIDSLIDLNFQIHGYIDIHERLSNPYNLNYLGDDNYYLNNQSKNYKYVVAVGNNKKRYDVSKRIRESKNLLATIIDKTSVISSSCIIRDGTFIGKNVIINSQSKIGHDVIINTGSIIEHECSIKDNVHVAPGSVICGGVIICEGTFIGANTVVKQGIEIGKHSIIGAGSVVLQDVKPYSKIYGNPAK